MQVGTLSSGCVRLACCHNALIEHRATPTEAHHFSSPSFNLGFSIVIVDCCPGHCAPSPVRASGAIHRSAMQVSRSGCSCSDP